jgi:hypothetical protein
MGQSATLNAALQSFGFVTVMKPTFYAYANGTPNWSDANALTLDSLRMSNITTEGPTKTVKGGLYAATQMRYGKTMRLEMEDVIGHIDTLTKLMGAYEASGATVADVAAFVVPNPEVATYYLPYSVSGSTYSVSVSGATTTFTATTDYTIVGNVVTFTGTGLGKFAPGDVIKVSYNYTQAGDLYITDRFSGYMGIKGQTFVINQATGEKEWIMITIPKFLPDSTFNITMEAEGDFGVTTINGDILPDNCGNFFYISKDGTSGCNA